jgi:hypothetical protein
MSAINFRIEDRVKDICSETDLYFGRVVSASSNGDTLRRVRESVHALERNPAVRRRQKGSPVDLLTARRLTIKLAR